MDGFGVHAHPNAAGPAVGAEFIQQRLCDDAFAVITDDECRDVEVGLDAAQKLAREGVRQIGAKTPISAAAHLCKTHQRVHQKPSG